jgi:hypothetical protein
MKLLTHSLRDNYIWAELDFTRFKIPTEYGTQIDKERGLNGEHNKQSKRHACAIRRTVSVV